MRYSTPIGDSFSTLKDLSACFKNYEEERYMGEWQSCNWSSVLIFTYG